MTESESSPKFKVGDEVRVIRNGTKQWEILHDGVPGEIGTILSHHMHTHPPDSYDVNLPRPGYSDHSQFISETCLEFADGPKESRSSSEADCIQRLKAFMDSL